MVQPDFETWNEWANRPEPIDELYDEWLEENDLTPTPIPEPTEKEQIQAKLDKIIKERVYVEDPAQVPEGVEPQEGEQGGIYYDTSEVEGDDPEDELPWANASFDEFGDVLTEQFGEEFVEDIVETLPESAAPEDAIALAEEKIRENTDEPDAPLNEMYQNLGAAVGSSLGPDGESEEDDVTDDEEVEDLDVPDGLDMDGAVSAVASVAGSTAAHALLGDMRASDSGEGVNPEKYVTQAASSLPRQARSQVQQAIQDYNEQRDAESEESEGDSEEEEAGASEENENEEEGEGDGEEEEGDAIVEVPTGELAENDYAEFDATVEVDGEEVDISDDPVHITDIRADTFEVDHPEHGEISIPHEAIEGSRAYTESGVEEAERAFREAAEGKAANIPNERRESVVKVEELRKPEIDLENNKGLRKVADNFIQVDDMLMEAFEKQIWEDDLNKAPNMWRRDDEVPQFVRSHVKEAIEKTDALYGDYSNIPHTAALKVHEIISDQLTDPQGWSIKTVTTALESEFDEFAKEQAESIARTEIASVLNKAREIAYDAAKAAAAANRARNITGLPDGERPEEMEVGYYWAGPEDHATTKICSETKDIIDNMGGFVSKDELKEILRSKAKEHEEEDGGLPSRVDSFVPHFNCRHTFIREDYQQVT